MPTALPQNRLAAARRAQAMAHRAKAAAEAALAAALDAEADALEHDGADASEWIAVPRTCEVLGITGKEPTRTASRQLREAGVEIHGLGRARVVRRADLERVIESRRITRPDARPRAVQKIDERDDARASVAETARRIANAHRRSA